MEGRVEGRVEGSVRRGVNSGGSQERGMVSDGGLVVSGTIGLQGCVVSRCQVSGGVQGSRSVDRGVQGWCSNNRCHDTCQIAYPLVGSKTIQFNVPHLVC